MSSEKLTTSRLFFTSVIEGRTDYDEKYDKAYNNLLHMTKNLTEKEAHDVMNKSVEDRKVHDETCLGLLVGILADPHKAPRFYKDLTFVSRDSLKVVTDHLQQMIAEKYSRLMDIARMQLMWLVRELVKTGVTNVECIVWCLLRQIAGGDISPKNVWLAESLVDILRENRPWLDKFSVIVASVTYTYLRILEDHHGPQFANLRQKEVAFVVSLLRERFQDCMKIGRDLVRILQNIAKIPEIEAVWKDMIYNPTSLAPNFTGLLQLLQQRTSKRFLLMRLTPEMEKKMVFLTGDVKFGMQKRYQEWFQRQYLNTTESQTLRCDLIRFIIGCIHPSNEVLCSDIIPRWAVIGWLLTSCTSPIVTANAKLALFYDWLVYNIDTDNIMNIEPGILVMYHSMRPHHVLTTSLLDFLCRIIPNFHPSLTEHVRSGVRNSLRQILEKRVVQSLVPLFDNGRMDADLRKLIRETFPDFCSSYSNDIKPEDFIAPVNSASVTKMDLMAETGLDFSPGPKLDSEPMSNHVNDDDAMFSDEDDDVVPRMRTKGDETPCRPSPPPTPAGMYSTNVITSTASNLLSLNMVPVACAKTENDVCAERTPNEQMSSENREDFNKHVNFLEKDMKNLLLDFKCEKNMRTRCDILQKICDLIFSEDLDQDESQHLAVCLCYLFNCDSSSLNILLPKDVNHETVEESISRPLFVLFDNLTAFPDDDHRRQSFLVLLAEMHKTLPHLGYHLLYFLKASSIRTNKEQDSRTPPSLQSYKDLCKATGQKDFAGFIVQDLQLCVECDPRLISWLIPDMYHAFPKQCTGNSEILQLVVERLDSSQLHDLVCMVLQGALEMFDDSSLGNILEKSLEWETIEQVFLWQLVRAHEIRVDCCLAVLPKLKFSSHTASISSTHGEALSNILMMLRRESPTEVLLKPLLQRECRVTDPTVATILQYWVQRYEDKMAKLINDIINNKQPPSPNKRKRNQSTKSSSIPLDQVLSHLNHLRTACDQTQFFKLSAMQEALQTAQTQCSESQKRKYGDLFALVEDDDSQPEPEPLSNRKAKSNRGRKAKTRKKQESESEEESSEDEELRKPSRKRKKNHQVGSDSD